MKAFKRAKACIAVHGFNVTVSELLSSLSSLLSLLHVWLSMASLGLTELLFGYVALWLLLLSLTSLEEFC